MYNQDRCRFSLVSFYLACSLLLVFGIPNLARAISFSTISSGPCVTSGNQDLSGFCQDVGIDYSQLTGNLVTSVHFQTNGVPNALDNVNRINGARSSIPGFFNKPDELKLAVARKTPPGCAQNAPVGTIFTSNGDPQGGADAQIVMVSPTAGVLSTVTLPNEKAPIRGGVFFDYQCTISNASTNFLVVVSGSEDFNATVGGNVWKIPINAGPSFGAPQLLLQITKPNQFGCNLTPVPAGCTGSGPATIPAHLEGVIIVPNDPGTYGPWAGQIVTGDEDRRSAIPVMNGNTPKIYAINPNTGACGQNTSAFMSPTCTGGTNFNVTGNNGVPHFEDIDFIDGDFYGVAFNNHLGTNLTSGQIMRAPITDFTGNGNILITQEYPQDVTLNNVVGIPVTSCPDVGTHSGLYQVQWNGSSFVATELTRTGGPLLCQWEHVTFAPASDVTIQKIPDGNSFNVGDNIFFTVTLTSVGPGTASNVVLTDPLPTPGNLSNWVVDSVTSTGLITPAPTIGSCSISGGNQLNCPIGSMAPGSTVTVTVRTNTAGGANSAACTTNNGRVDNIATVTADGPISKQDPGFWLCQAGSYTLTKNPKNATYNIGQNINFTMVVTSTGPGTANNVVLNDPLPTLGNLNHWTLTTNPGGVCTIVSNTLNCPFGNLANGQTRTVVVSTDASGGADITACPGGQKLNNTATLTGTGLPTLTDTGDYTCTPPGAYTLVKSPKNAVYNIGDNINFTMVVTSTGPGSVNNVVLNDPLPTLGNLNNWIISSNPGGCTIVSNVLNCQFGTLASGATRTVVVATNASGGANISACPGGQKLNNTATLTGTGQPTLTDTGDWICTPPGGYTLVKSPKNATYNLGDNISFTMVVTSTGPGSVNNVVLNDPLPTLGNLNNWILSSSPGGCTIVSNVLNCQFGTLASGASRTVIVSTNAPGGANITGCPGGVKLNNTATLTGTGQPTLTDTGDYICTPPGSYTLTKTPKNAVYNIGDNINFTMVVTSTGPGSVNNVVLNDPLPTLGNLNNWIISSNPGGCTIVSNVLNCQFGTLANGATRTIIVSTNASGGANITACPGGVKLNNTATLTGTGQPTLTDTGDYICTPPGAYTLTKSPKNATYNLGDNISFSMVVTSTGPGTVNNVALNDPLPTLGNLNNWIIIANPGGCTIVSNNLNCQFGSLAAGATRTVIVSTNIPGGANITACPGGVKLNNTATLTGTGQPTLTDTGDYICAPPGSYTLTKNPKNATYNVGDNITFTMVVASTGPGTANNVVLNDPLPTLGNLNNWTIASSPGGCTIVANTLNCQFGNLPNGQVRTVVLTTNAPGGADITACPGNVKLNNTATLTGTGLPTLTDTGDYICQPPTITLTKTPKNATFNVGDQLTFTMVVSSNGPGTANNVTLTDPLPTTTGFTWVVSSVTPSGNCSINAAQLLSCTFGNLPQGAQRTVVVKTNNSGGASQAACNGNRIPNVATASASGLPNVSDTGDYVCTCPPDQSQLTTSVDAAGNVTVNFIQSLINANDNSYGTTAVGWDKGHKFSDLTGSDKAEFIFRDKAGNIVLDFFLDYLSATAVTPSTPSGFASLGVSGGDGDLVSGNAAFITAFNTSLAKNLNTTGFCSGGNCTVAGTNLLVNSPPTVCTDNTVPCYALPPGSPFGAWDFRNIYTVTINGQAFAAGGGFGSVEIGNIHNSPSKGTATICGPCPPESTTTSVTTDANGNIVATINQSLTQANDNSYGTTAVGWVKGHKFSDLTGSDHAEFIFKDSNGNIVLDFFLDYLSATAVTAQTPSGFATLGVSGGDGKLITGNAANILSFNTSLDENLNDHGFCSGGNCTVAGTNLLVNSPPTICTDNTVACYTLPPGSPFGAWNFTNSYTVTINKNAFGAAGFGSFEAGDIHNSPSKGTPNICPVTGGGGGGNTHLLTVASTNPSSGVTITSTPTDVNGQDGGTTQFVRVFSNNAQVTLTAPATAGGNNFVNWTGCDTANGTTCNVTLSADKTVTANYAAATATRTLTVASSNPNSGVSITVSQNDNNGQGNGTTQFTRTYNNNAQVTLTAPATAGGNNFSGWTGCDVTFSNSCTVTLTANRTVTANYTTSGGGNPTISLGFDGLVRDRVGQCDTCITPDGLLDGTFTVTLGAASGNRTVTSLNLTRSGPIGIWDTIPNGFWVLGAASGLDTALFNAANGTVNFPLTAGSSFKAFAADFFNATFPNGLFMPGATFTLTANFSDGSTASANVTVGGGSPTSVLTVASSNPGSGVSINVSPNDNNGQGAGISQFTRTFNNNTTVTLTAPATSGSNTFSNWTGCDSAITTTCNVTLTASRTVTANYTTASGGPNVSLSFDGLVRDRVGQGEGPSFLAPDGQFDGTFTVTLLPSSGNRTVTSIKLTRTGPIGIWDTVPNNGFWVLGTASGLDTALLNGSDGSVNFPLTAGASFKIFAANFFNATFPNGLYIGGSNFVVTVTFSDGSTATANVTL